MKTKSLIHLTTALLLSTLNSQLSTAHAQGSLTPPGAPAPTMKTLAQIEPRTAITNTASAVTISQPGSYYLTGNLTVSSGNAITIATNGVTLDLNGFTISSTAASAAGNGILLSGSNPRNLTILNGFIQGGVTNNGSGVFGGSGFNAGIIFSGNPPVNVLVSRVSVSGCLYYGIILNIGDSTVVESCTVRTVGSIGIYASTIKTSSVIDCGSTAIAGEQVSDCRGQSTGNGTGVSATTAQNCYGYSSSGIGVYATTAQNCSGSSSSGTGVYATATAQNCYGDTGGSGFGVVATTAQNCYGSSSSGYGVTADRVAIGCYGSSSTGTGLYAQNANTCTGSRSGGTAIQATIANGCYAASGTNIITYKYNMP